jgi:orotate phosphoribosyltransferase
MSEVSQKVAEMLLSTESIAVYKDKPFVFVSGRISPVYIDCRKLLSFAAEREYIVTALAKKAETDIGLDNIDVVPRQTAGIPYAAFVSHLIKKPMIYIRKQPKGYGGTKQIEGILEPGKRVMLVEDLITDGLSKLRFNIGIRGAGAKMTSCLCVFDYASDRLNQHEGKINLAKNDIALHVLANWDDVLDTGRARNYFSAEQNQQIIDFLKIENWGGRWGSYRPVLAPQALVAVVPNVQVVSAVSIESPNPEIFLRSFYGILRLILKPI